MVYISDHGETPHDGRWRDVTAKAFYELPMFIWLSTEYRKRFPETVERCRSASIKSLQSDELFYGLLELAQVHCQHEGFISNKFVSRKARLINDGKGGTFHLHLAKSLRHGAGILVSSFPPVEEGLAPPPPEL